MNMRLAVFFRMSSETQLSSHQTMKSGKYSSGRLERLLIPMVIYPLPLYILITLNVCKGLLNASTNCL